MPKLALFFVSLTAFFITLFNSSTTVQAGCSGVVKCVQADCIAYNAQGVCTQWSCNTNIQLSGYACGAPSQTQCMAYENTTSSANCPHGCYINGCVWSDPPGPGVSTPTSTPKPPTTTCKTTCSNVKTCLTPTDCFKLTGIKQPTDVRCNTGSISKYWCTQKQCTTVCPTSSPTPIQPSPTPIPTASCQMITAYDNTWTALTSTQLSNLRAGNVINFCASGVASAGVFDQARFTINNTLFPVTNTLRPNNLDICQSYTIPANTYNFAISAELHHTLLGWVQ